MKTPDWTDLNAYVDGELRPDAAAEIAARIAADPAVAAQVATLARLKAATAAALSPASAEVPEIRLGRGVRGPGWRRHGARAAAAAVLLVVALGLGQWLWPRPDAVQAWLQQATERHAQWLAAERDPAPIAPPAIRPADAPDGPSWIPDLALARLAVAHVAATKSNGRPELYVGYVGVNGCRLGLWIGPAPARLAASLAEHRDGDVTSFTWRAGDIGYAVMARGMDEARLRAVAAYLETATRQSLDESGETEVARRPAAAADAPCIG
ncbi:hypothetical protein [Rhodospirillaceae bacterium SYSU D60014]|uniref:hypothetical protein n=1 Tax=Virgifigura deserti TaxID=2268457 RepID=UPI000E668A0B